MEQTVKKKAYIRDMTEGNIFRHIIIFALPLMAATACQQIYNLVDTMVAGHSLGDTAIAAIGAVTPIYSLLMSIANGFNNGCGVVVTQYFGSHNQKAMKQAVMATYLCNAVLTAGIMVIAFTFMNGFLNLMNVPANIYDDAYLYIMVICGGMVTTVLYNMFAGIMRAFGNSRVPLIIVVISSIIHVFLDVLFINVMKMGVAGTAASTVISQGISAVAAWIYTYRNYREYLPKMTERHVDKEIIGDTIRIGTGMSLTVIAVCVGTLLFQSANNSLGDIFITAYTSARRIIDLSMIPVSTLAMAVTTFIAQNWGAKKYDRIKKGIKNLLCMQLVWSALVFVFIYAFGRQIIVAETGSANEEVISNAVLALRLFVPFYAPLSVLYCFRMSLQGMGYTAVTVLSSSIEMVFKFVSAFTLIPVYGFVATCITEPITWILCAIYLTIAYFVLVKRGLYKDKNADKEE